MANDDIFQSIVASSKSAVRPCCAKYTAEGSDAGIPHACVNSALGQALHTEVVSDVDSWGL
jgi:hypothetical protein